MLNLHRGLTQQAMIIATAPLIGILGTSLCIVGSFRGTTGEKWTIMMAVISCLGTPLYPAAYCIVLAMLTTWSRNYLTHRGDALLAEINVHEDTRGTRLESRYL